MSERPLHMLLFTAFGLALAGPLALAQDAMPGMDMPGTQPPAPSHADHAPGGRVAPRMHHTMPGMARPGRSGMQANPSTSTHGPHALPAGIRQARRQPPASPSATGIQTLRAGQQVGLRPVTRGLGVQATDPHAMDNMPPMQGGSPPPGARSPDYSDGVAEPVHVAGMTMMEDTPRLMLLANRLEAFHGRDGNGTAIQAQAWYGNDDDKLWTKIEGGYGDGRLQDGRAEVLWSHALAAYWDGQLGVRHDFGAGPGRSWTAMGVQGRAPYGFDVEATAYVGSSGRTAVRLETQYELSLTQRLVAQPDLEANLYGRDDVRRGVGAGFSDLAAGVRLRYEIDRQCAPYVGVVWTRRFGRTAELARMDGQPARERRWVAGLRLWF